MDDLTDTGDTEFEELLLEVARASDVSGLRRNLAPGIVLAERFELQQPLGRGGMGRVYVAYDRRRQARVALKLLGRVTPEAVLQMKLEFRVAAELNHPNLVRLHELFCDGTEWFFTMELIEGLSLAELLVDGRPLPAAELWNVFPQLAQALSELHRSGTLHRDLTPANFLITPDRRVVLLDFGLAWPIAGGPSRYEGCGTPGYMSPEQEAGGKLTAASDWYSFGVVLYEALTGHRPHTFPVAIPEVAPESAALASLAVDLLERDPARRAAAAAVLRTLGIAPVSAFTSSNDRKVVMVGRDDELRRLRAALRSAFERTEPAVALVHGPSGIGKTTLVRELVAEMRRKGAVVLAGRCRERESVAYKAVDALIDDLVAWVDGLPAAEAALLIPAGIGDLTRLFPALRAARAIARAPHSESRTLDEAMARLSARAAFLELMSNLASRAPLVIWIDDLQWSDTESAFLLAPLIAPRSGLAVAFIGSCRNTAEANGPVIDALYGRGEYELAAPAELSLAPLREDESKSLALSLLPESEPLANELAEAIARDASGNPLFIVELAQTIRSEGVHLRPSSLSDLMQSRIRELPEDARGLLGVMALAGAPLSRTVARTAKGLDPERLERALDALRARRLVRTSGMEEDSDLDLLHDRIREIIRQGLSDEERRSEHLGLARALQAQPNARPELVATHFAAAGALAEAGAQWIIAADRAAHSLAFARAAELYHLGAQYSALDADQRHSVLLREASALGLAGRGAEAAELYLRAARTRPRDEALALRRLAGHQLLLVGHLERGVALMDQVLRDLGVRPTRRGRALLPSFLLGRARLSLRGFEFTRRSELDLSSLELERIDAAWTVASALGSTDFLRAADLQNVHLMLALDAGEPKRLLRALTLEASYCAALGNRAQMERVLAVIDRLSATVEDRSVHGLAEMLQGLADYVQGYVYRANVNFERALEICAAHWSDGVVFETITAHRFRAAALFYLGRIDELSRLIPTLLHEAVTHGNLYATMVFRSHFGTVAWLARDDVAEARQQVARARAEWTSTEFEVPRCSIFIGETYLALYTGDFAGAWSRMNEYWPKIVSSNLLRIGVLRLQLWYLRAACALGAARAELARGNERAARSLRKHAYAAAWRVSEQHSQLAEPLGLLLLGIVDASEGRAALAEERLRRAIARMDRDGLKLFAAVARMRLAAIEPALAPELQSEARAAFASEGVACVDRMAAMLAPA